VTTPTEGVIHFDLHHRPRPLPTHLHPALAELAAWRDLLVRLGGIGQDPTRYDGAGFGNVSARTGPFPGPRGQRPFLITATQTGGEPCTDPTRFAHVHRCDARTNRVESEGPARPSSESLTHGALYDLDAAIRYVFHIHSPHIWRTRALTRLPTTRPDIPYGTPAMAQEMARLANTGLLERRIVIMAGHEDGVIGFGRTAEEAGMVLMGAWAQARAMAFGVDGGICVDGWG
jgi:L-ribulose-5-phosphate 4-epimerase